MVEVEFTSGDTEDVLVFRTEGDQLEIARAARFTEEDVKWDTDDYAVTRRGVGSQYGCIESWELRGTTLVLDLSLEGRTALQLPARTELDLDAAGCQLVSQHLADLLA